MKPENRWGAAVVLATGLVFAPWAARAGTNTFSNPAAITINDAANASPYPSTINVSGLTGTVVQATLQLNGFSHTCPGDVVVALAAPSGAFLVPMNQPGPGLGCPPSSNATLQFADGSPSLPYPPVSGTYAPTNTRGDVGQPPADLCGTGGSPVTTLSSFNGAASADNGTWSLYVADCFAEDEGQFAGGWSITFLTVNNTGNTVPTMEQGGLVGLALLLFGLGTLALRRRSGFSPRQSP